MGATRLKSGNDTLLETDYNDPKTIKKLLRNWSGMEAMRAKGDTVATCVLLDLERVTGMDLDYYDKDHRDPFNGRWQEGVLSQYQYMGIAYTLVLGYSQMDIAFMMGVDQSVITKNINRGVKRICSELMLGGKLNE